MDPSTHRLPTAGDVLAGRYLLISPLGVGASATVWRGLDQRLGREVAVKITAERQGASDGRGISDEARTAASLDHAGIVAVHDVVPGASSTAIVMALVPGESLAARLQRDGPLPEGTALALVADVADALAHAHARGVLHCDVKPANILIDLGGRARLADFGIAQAGQVSAAALATGSTAPVPIVEGTLRALAPERLRGADPTPAADVFALGVVLFETLTGRPPWSASTPAEMLRAQRAAPDVRSLPPSIRTLLAACLSPDPLRRPTAREMSVALRRTRIGSRTGTATADAATNRIAPAMRGAAAGRRSPRRRVGLAAAGGISGMAIAVAILGVIALPGFSPRSTPSPSTRVASATALPIAALPSFLESLAPAQPAPPSSPVVTSSPTQLPTIPPATAATPPLRGLRILAPSSGTVVATDAVVVGGLAAPGATITRDIPMWPDDHVQADAAGRWSMKVQLRAGENVLRFRVGDDRSTEVDLRIVSAT